MKHKYPVAKDPFTAGFERMLNNKQASILNNPHIFNEIVSASGMTATQAIRHIGKGKSRKQEDREKSEKRLETLEEHTEGSK